MHRAAAPALAHERSDVVTAQTSLRVAYLVSRYPLASHTFIEREIDGLRALGVHVETFTVRRTPPEEMLGDHMRREDRATTALVDTGLLPMLGLAMTLASRPGVTLAMVRHALGTGQPQVRARLKQLLYLAEAFRLHTQMRRRGLRHVHAHFANVAADVARLAVRIGRVVDGEDSPWRWTMTMHGPTEFEAVDHFDLRAKVEDAAAVACISDFTRSQLMRLTSTDHWPDLEIVRMSVDGGALGPPAEPRSHEGATRVLYVGRLVAEKGSPVLVEAMQVLMERGVDAVLRIVGAGPLEETLRAQVVAAGLQSRVSLTGALGQEEIRECYHWADVFCLPSFQEGLPVALMEAMATGLPVVTTQIAGIPELVIDDVVGRVLTPGRPDLVADALEQLTDPDLRRLWGDRGPLHVEHHHDLRITAQAQRHFLERAQHGKR